MSDRATAGGRGRLPIVFTGFVLASAAIALFPASAKFGIAGLVGARVVLYTGINLQRSPFQALVADLVPSRYRSVETGSVTFQMCVGAIVFLLLGRTFGMQAAFLIAAAAVLTIAFAFALGLPEPPVSESHAAEATPVAFRCRVVRRARRRAGHAGYLLRGVPAAADVSDVHHVVCASRHGALRRPT